VAVFQRLSQPGPNNRASFTPAWSSWSWTTVVSQSKPELLSLRLTIHGILKHFCVRTSDAEKMHFRIIANAVVRSKGDKATYIGHELDKCKDYSALSYRLPLEKACLWKQCAATKAYKIHPGIYCGLGCAKGHMGWRPFRRSSTCNLHPVIQRSLIQIYFQVNPTESTVLMTEPYFNLPKIQEVYDQFIFEEYEFQAYFRATRQQILHVRHYLSLTCPGQPRR
jgi:hypothetical protein